MNLQELEKLYLHRQSCRSFDTEKTLSEDLLKEVCRIALLAPSACNSQPWKLLAVTGEKKKEVEPALQSLGMNKFASDAQALIAVCANEGKLSTKIMTMFKATDFMQNDIGILTAHLVLAAECAGLSTCILGWRKEKQLAKALGLGENANVPLVVAIGYAKEDDPIREKKRKPFEDSFELLK